MMCNVFFTNSCVCVRDAWIRLGEMSSENAMAAYVEEMKKVAQEVHDRFISFRFRFQCNIGSCNIYGMIASAPHRWKKNTFTFE